MLDDSAYAALCSAVTLQSNEKGFFRNTADDVAEAAGADWLRHFATLRSNRERIAECVTNKRVKHLVLRMMDNVREVYRGKSATMSKQRRLEAEHLYGNGKPDKALLMFTQSVVKAPFTEAVAAERGGENDRSLALALWGRSVIFYERRQMLRCLEDVQLSLRQKLPEEFRVQAYSRMAECYASLRRFDEARITRAILSRLTGTQVDTCSTVVDQTEDGAAGSEAAVGTEAEASRKLAEGEHARLRQVSSKLTLTQTDEAGRFFVAAESIRTGDTLVAEDAYVSCLSVERFGSHCHHCMRRLETAMPCSECSAVAFCSLACRSVALDSYHRFECRYLDLLIGSGMSVLCFAALRIVTQQSVAYFESAHLDDERVDGDGDGDGGHPYGRIYSLVGHERSRTADDYFRRTLMAIFLSSVLMKSDYFGVGVEPRRHNQAADFSSREMLIAAVILRNLEVLQFNAHEISETVRVGNAVKTSTIGVGLYASASFFNHECFPAVTRFFRGNTLIVRAVRPVQKGRVVGDCYGPSYDKFDTLERRRRLRARYWFECECLACLQDWPLAEKLGHFLRIRCGRCGAAIDNAESTKGSRCARCDAGTEQEYEAASKQVDQLWRRLETAAKNATPEAIEEICDTVDSLDRRLFPPHQIYRQVAHALTRYWSQPSSPTQPSSIEPSDATHI